MSSNTYTLSKPLNEIVLEYFPTADEDEIGYILWNHTGFPSFWRIPENGANPEECLRKALLELKAHMDTAGKYPDYTEEWDRVIEELRKKEG
jgi:hypothetical protein